MEFNALTLRHPRVLLRAAKRKVGRILRGERTPPPPPPAPPPADQIDVRDLIACSSLEELNRKAEEYFSTLESWDHHLAKPFSTIADAPQLLINFATVLQGLNLAPGLRVLDFGAGTGWTARWLTQLGCQVVLLDVSATALEIARELYRRQPVIGDRPVPEFLHYDGRRIALPDASVDRILCFDAFHHSTDPEATIREFARILKPGGIAAFAEPGPEHSKSERSQFEMRNYGVIENDVDIHQIWRTAQQAGFDRIHLAAFNVPPFHVSLEQHGELLAGGETYLRWAQHTREFMRNVRNFFLRRVGEEDLDSRRTEGLGSTIEISLGTSHPAPGEAIAVRASVMNSGTSRWLPSSVIPGGVSLGCHLLDADGRTRQWDFHWEPLTDPPRQLAPGETVSLTFSLPPLPEGAALLEFDCVADASAGSTRPGRRP